MSIENQFKFYKSPAYTSERSNWGNIPEKLRGRALDSLEELNHLFSQESMAQVQALRTTSGGSKLYGLIFPSEKLPFTFGTELYFAYGCSSCKKIIVGPPIITPVREDSCRVYCAFCPNVLYDSLKKN